jgi:hypothetical protein
MPDPWWTKHGYLAGKQLTGDCRLPLWLCVAEMAYTWRLMVCDQADAGVHEFWCYPKEKFSNAEVIVFMFEFDGNGDPHEGWVKHHPSQRRPQSTCPGCNTFGHGIETCPIYAA